MAYITNPYDKQREQEQQDDQRRQAPSGQSVYSTSTSTPAASPTAPAESKGSGYVSLDKYRQANKGSGEILAGQVADKAAKEFDNADAEIGNLNTAVSGVTADDDFLKGIGSTSGLSADQEAKLNQIKNFAPKDLDSSAYNSAYQSGYDKAKSYGNRDVQLAALQDIFNNGELRAKGITYNTDMGALDANLMADNGKQITDAVDGIAKGVADRYKTKTVDYNTNKQAAVETTKSSWDKIKTTADAARSKLQDDNFKELSRLNLGNKATPDGKVVDRAGTDGRYGDVLTADELAAASKYESILGGKTFDNTDKTFSASTYKDKPVADTTPGKPGQIMIDPDMVFPTGDAPPASSAPSTTNIDPGPIAPGTVQIDPSIWTDPQAPAPSQSSSSGGGGSLDKYKQKQKKLDQR